MDEKIRIVGRTKLKQIRSLVVCNPLAISLELHASYGQEFVEQIRYAREASDSKHTFLTHLTNIIINLT